MDKKFIFSHNYNLMGITRKIVDFIRVDMKWTLWKNQKIYIKKIKLACDLLKLNNKKPFSFLCRYFFII